ncbi:MAG: hypothetical protein D6758_10305 [Gammaproteobacteria bacterium]|nr:MAG: hypothetical protein D6758_10305 [Gammaproteobacteria bacterium]
MPENRFELRAGDAVIARGSLDDLRMEPRLGETPRQIHVARAGLFETTDHAAADALQQRQSAHSGWLHRLENNLPAVAVSALLALAILFATLRWGVPAAMDAAARHIPVSLAQSVGEGSLAWLDEHLFEPSTLPSARQQHLRAAFERIRPAQTLRFALHFRASPVLGPNALALPSGDIILTDELVELADNDEQILAVLLHEQGHVVQRHGLRLALRQAGVVTLVTLITGDVSTASQLLTAVPLIVTQLGYSREMEREADAYAVSRMRDEGMDTGALITILTKLTEAQGQTLEEAEDESGFWSTHPLTHERIEAIRQAR